MYNFVVEYLDMDDFISLLFTEWLVLLITDWKTGFSLWYYFPKT